MLIFFIYNFVELISIYLKTKETAEIALQRMKEIALISKAGITDEVVSASSDVYQIILNEGKTDALTTFFISLSVLFFAHLGLTVSIMILEQYKKIKLGEIETKIEFENFDDFQNFLCKYVSSFLSNSTVEELDSYIEILKFLFML